MWPFKSKPKELFKDKVAALRPGERMMVTCGPAGAISIACHACEICGKVFHVEYSFPLINIRPLGDYYHTAFGKYKPKTIWYCGTHTNKEIEQKIAELDV